MCAGMSILQIGIVKNFFTALRRGACLLFGEPLLAVPPPRVSFVLLIGVHYYSIMVYTYVWLPTIFYKEKANAIRSLHEKSLFLRRPLVAETRPPRLPSSEDSLLPF